MFMKKVKAYLTMNIIPHNDDMANVSKFIEKAVLTGIDAVIVSDPGMFTIIKSAVPELDIHISTQANITNTETVKFWHLAGATRVVLARELSINEIKRYVPILLKI